MLKVAKSLVWSNGCQDKVEKLRFRGFALVAVCVGPTLLLYWEEEEEEDGCYSPSEPPSSLFTLCQTSGTSPADPWCLECFHSSPPDPPSGCSGYRAAHHEGRGQLQRISCPGPQGSRLVFARTKTSSLRRFPRVGGEKMGECTQGVELTGGLSRLPLPPSHLPSLPPSPPPPPPHFPNQPRSLLPQITTSLKRNCYFNHTNSMLW